MEKSSVVVVGLLCVMLVVIQSGRTPYGLRKIKPEFVKVNNGGDEFYDIGSFIQKYRKQLSRRFLKKGTYESNKNKAEFISDAFFDNGNFIEEEKQQRYARGTGGGSAGANGDYYDYGSCIGVRDNVPMTSCDQCIAACANIFTKPLCTYDSVNKGAYVCTCCI
ncbi:hypothetical protein C5167_041083 [Papaver somniferum]|uniref:Gnk2-homologous domain-containing protein n=1 Tax=Papaver somniferum TaxID=3469 RepID=A0A4Y7IK82_PAPSO|nr:hypothetical protein C5167_041083 [Papaver somniferum]